MNTKLTLRMDRGTIKKAKEEAARRGKSLSRMVAEFVESLDREDGATEPLPPITASLVGVLRKSNLSEEHYRAYLKRKYL